MFNQRSLGPPTSLTEQDLINDDVSEQKHQGIRYIDPLPTATLGYLIEANISDARTSTVT